MAEDTKDGGPKTHDQPTGRLEEDAPDRGHPTEIETKSARSSGDYEVGYGRPPKHSRFKPGQSGNPKGRRRKVKGESINAQQMLANKLRETRRVRINGEEVEREMMDLLIEQYLVGLAGGRIRSLQPLIDFTDWIDQMDAKREAGSSDGVDYEKIVRAKFEDMVQRVEERRRREA